MNKDKYDVNGNVIDDVDDTNLGKEVRFFKGWVKDSAILLSGNISCYWHSFY